MSKEIMNFNYEGKMFDVSYVDNYVYIYVVIDRLSGLMVSQLIPSANDFVATIGFKNFCDQKQKENDLNVYRLVRVACLNTQTVEFFDTEKFDIFDSSDDLQKFIDEAKSYILSQED